MEKITLQEKEFFIEFTPKETEREEQTIEITVRQNINNKTKDIKIALNLIQLKELFDYLDIYLSENADLLNRWKAKVASRESQFKFIYEKAKETGIITYWDLMDLSELGTLILPLLAKDFAVSVDELKDLAMHAPLPSAFLEKHYLKCKENMREHFSIHDLLTADE